MKITDIAPLSRGLDLDIPEDRARFRLLLSTSYAAFRLPSGSDRRRKLDEMAQQYFDLWDANRKLISAFAWTETIQEAMEREPRTSTSFYLPEHDSQRTHGGNI